MNNGQMLWDKAKQIAVTTTVKCRSFMDRVSGAEAAKRITTFHDDVETLSSALITRVNALDTRSKQSSADLDARLRALESRGRMQMAISLAALIIAIAALFFRFWRVA